MAKVKGPGSQLSLIFDNCAGQNKNRMVLRFAQYLVDIQVFKRVQIIFLIMGHTKNICDRRFKDLKKIFHHRNVYSFPQLTQVLSECNKDYVSVIPVTTKDFFDWDQFFNDNKYKKSVKDCSKFHCFYYSDDYEGKIVKQYTINKDKKVKESIVSFVKNATNEEVTLWKQNLKTKFPKVCENGGLPEIKQVELYTKWRHLLPNEYQDIMCPKPDDNILLRVKKQRSEKAKAKRNNKSGTSNNSNNNK